MEFHMRRIPQLLLVASLAWLAGCHDTKSSRNEGIANTYPANPSAPYASVLKMCASAEHTAESCSLSRLPTLGMEVENPSVEDIRDRLLVSHAWMAERFMEVLHELPPDMYRLFGAVTAVVIDDDIRPSYYTSTTGAIYLDPAGLWLTLAELADINPHDDYRGEYIRQMSYRPFWRYTSPNVDFGTRNLQTITLDMARLLFHELAHANDLFPPSTYDRVNTSQRIANVIDSLRSEFPSTRLQKRAPLQSDDMKRLASILYRGATPTASERAYTGVEVGVFFEPDVASDDYAYSSQHEDLAMLFEEVMMKVYFDMDRDIAFVEAPEREPQHCDDYKIGWGVRNRLGEERVKERARWVVEQILPDSDYSEWLDSFPEPQPLPVGAGWCESEGQAGPLFDKSLTPPVPRPAPDLRDFLRPPPLVLEPLTQE
jgi:hypothetical protein